ncbi:hypothetical protein DA2_0498 [Desulfovibrio sp. A2]|nr:hypothetical protein DA2_0498 [Desulfovibrio sp. A2]
MLAVRRAAKCGVRSVRVQYSHRACFRKRSRKATPRRDAGGLKTLRICPASLAHAPFIRPGPVRPGLSTARRGCYPPSMTATAGRTGLLHPAKGLSP